MEGSKQSQSQSLSLRAEIDTSAPIESVKEAVIRFGGVAITDNKITDKASSSKHHIEEFGSEKLEEQAAVLEKELILKERETFDGLKELEITKRFVEDLKSKLQKEESKANLNLQMSVCDQRSAVKEKEKKENQARQLNVLPPSKKDFILYPSSTTPGLTLMELKQANLNLIKTFNVLARLRVSIKSLNRKLEKERISVEESCEMLTRNSLKISSLEEELNWTRLRLQVAKKAEIKCASGDPSDITREMQQLSSEAEHFKKIREAAKSEVLRTMSEIEETKSMIRTAEIWLVAARKTKVAARAAEVVALAEINALSNHENSSRECMQKHEGITLSFEEYTALTCKARDAEEQSMKRVIDAMLEVEEANLSRMDISKRVEEATEEVKTCKKGLEEALERVEAANRGKLAVEEALRKLQYKGHKRSSSMHNSTKFKNSYPSHRRRDSRIHDVNGRNLVNDESEPVLKPQEFEAGMPREKMSVKWKVSLGQMLRKQNKDPSFDRQHEKENGQKEFFAKKKKFGFTRLSLLFSKQQKKKPT